MKRELELRTSEALKVDQDLLYGHAVPCNILGENVLVKKKLKVQSFLLPSFLYLFDLF